MTMTGTTRSWRPDEVRRRDFTVRFRGLDPNEVRGFLNVLADDIARLYDQISALTQDNTRLRGELEKAKAELQVPGADPHEAVTEQAVLLLDQAQQLADALIEEGMQSARDMMLAARTHQREIVDPSAEAAGLAPAGVTGSAAGAASAAVTAEVEDVRMFAKVAQVQFKAVLDALNEQVSRLGQFSDTEEASAVINGDHHPPRSAAASADRT